MPHPFIAYSNLLSNTDLTVMPGNAATDVYSEVSYPKEYLTQVWHSAGFQPWRSVYQSFVITTKNQKIYFNDGSDRTVTLTIGVYRAANLAAEIETQLNANASTRVFTCVFTAASSGSVAGSFLITVTSGGAVTWQLNSTTAAFADSVYATIGVDCSLGTVSSTTLQTSATAHPNGGVAGTQGRFVIPSSADDLVVSTTGFSGFVITTGQNDNLAIDFSDGINAPAGPQNVVLDAGSYTGTTLAAHIQAELRLLQTLPGAEFVCTYDTGTKLFTIALPLGIFLTINLHPDGSTNSKAIKTLGFDTSATADLSGSLLYTSAYVRTGTGPTITITMGVNDEIDFVGPGMGGIPATATIPAGTYSAQSVLPAIAAAVRTASGSASWARVDYDYVESTGKFRVRHGVSSTSWFWSTSNAAATFGYAAADDDPVTANTYANGDTAIGLASATVTVTAGVYSARSLAEMLRVKIVDGLNVDNFDVQFDDDTLKFKFKNAEAGDVLLDGSSGSSTIADIIGLDDDAATTITAGGGYISAENARKHTSEEIVWDAGSGLTIGEMTVIAAWGNWSTSAVIKVQAHASNLGSETDDDWTGATFNETLTVTSGSRLVLAGNPEADFAGDDYASAPNLRFFRFEVSDPENTDDPFVEVGMIFAGAHFEIDRHPQYGNQRRGIDDPSERIRGDAANTSLNKKDSRYRTSLSFHVLSSADTANFEALRNHVRAGIPFLYMEDISTATNQIALSRWMELESLFETTESDVTGNMFTLTLNLVESA